MTEDAIGTRGHDLFFTTSGLLGSLSFLSGSLLSSAVHLGEILCT